VVVKSEKPKAASYVKIQKTRNDFNERAFRDYRYANSIPKGWVGSYCDIFTPCWTFRVRFLRSSTTWAVERACDEMFDLTRGEAYVLVSRHDTRIRAVMVAGRLLAKHNRKAP